MSKKIQLTIPTPCHENWDAMTPVDKGKFCGSCQKKVVDFSNMSDREVAQFFKKPSTGSVCGRFMSDQLDRDMEIPKKRIPWVKYFFQILLPAFLVSSKAAANKTQGKIKITSTSKSVCEKTLTGDTILLPGSASVPKPVPTPQIPGRNIVCTEMKVHLLGVTGQVAVKQQNASTINGQVTDETGYPLPGAIVQVSRTLATTVSDNTGWFRINGNIGDTVVVYGAGLNRTEATVGNNNMILISVKRMIMGGPMKVVMIGRTSEKKKPQKRVEIPLLKQIFKDTVSIFFKVYPNPISPGASLTIEWKHTEEGYYLLQLLNQSGQSLHQKEIWIDAEARILSIDLPVIPAGSYFMVLTNKKSAKRFAEKIIIQ